MLLSGDVTSAGSFEERDLRTFLGPFTPEPPNEAAEGSGVEIVGYAADGEEVLRQRSAVGVRYDDYIDQEPWSRGVEGSVRAHFPALPNLHRVAVELSGAEVWFAEATAAAPVADVTIDDMTVRWKVTDDDSEVDVVVYFFDDEGAPEVIASSTDEAGEIDLNDAGLNAAVGGNVVVFATDGFNSAVASGGPVGVAQTPPELYLDWPEGGLTWNATTWLGLDVGVIVAGRGCVGSCETPEGHEVIWYSDIDGEIARGVSVEIFPEADGYLPLSIGTHEITVVVTDDHGNRVETQSQLTIVD